MDARAHMQRVIDRYLAAYAGHDADGCAGLFTEDAVLLSPFGPPAIGQDAIRATHRDWFLEEEANKVMTVARAAVEEHISHCLVAFSADVPGDTGQEKSYGASLCTLRKGVDDSWLICQISLNELEDDLNGLLP